MDLAWDPSPDSNIVAYVLYFGPQSRTYTNSTRVSDATSAHVTGLIRGAQYFITVTAIQAGPGNGVESDYANEISVVAFGDVSIEMATNVNGPWLTLTSMAAPRIPSNLFRVAINSVPIVTVESSTNRAGPWTRLFTYQITNPQPVQFFRAAN